MASIFNFFKTGGAYKTSSSTTSTAVTETTSSENSSTITTECNNWKTHKELTLNLKSFSLTYSKDDLKELQSLKDNELKYKPTLLHLFTIYSGELQKHVEFGTKFGGKVEKVNVEKTYTTNHQIIDTSHYLALQQGYGVEGVTDGDEFKNGNDKARKLKKQLLDLEKQYANICRDNDNLRSERNNYLSEDEIIQIEEEEGRIRKRAHNYDDEDETGAKRKAIEQERQLINKRLQEERKQRSAYRFYCKGEVEYLKECLDGGKAGKVGEYKRYDLKPTNVFDMQAEEIHYRICESQFYRQGSSPGYGSSYPTAMLTEVEYNVNPNIISKYNNCKKALAKKHSFMLDSMKPLLLFHGTSVQNMENIIKTNFLVDKIGSTTDMGWYGKGFYFSEYPGLSMAYARNEYLLVCVCLIGKAFHMQQVETGRAIEPGYDSHVSPDGCSEVIIFNPDQIIPMYKVKWVQQGSFDYSKSYL
ncbi:hypothetical protein ABK040_003428 [Willaertia magna]